MSPDNRCHWIYWQ